MSKIIERCSGIDVGKRFLLCSVFASDGGLDAAASEASTSG
jgi:hypothetical protein